MAPVLMFEVKKPASSAIRSPHFKASNYIPSVLEIFHYSFGLKGVPKIKNNTNMLLHSLAILD